MKYLLIIANILYIGLINKQLEEPIIQINDLGIIEISLQPVEWEDYKTEAFILDSKIRTYDNDFQLKSDLNFNKDIFKVDIVSKTKEMRSTTADAEDICSFAYYLKIKFDNSEYIVSGKDIYQRDNDTIFCKTNFVTKDTELFPITNFSVGASYKEELFGCDDYSPLIIKEKNTFYKIEVKENNRYYAKKNNFGYCYLTHDEGSLERIMSISIKGDTIIAKIHVEYQDGNSDYDLNIVKNNDKYLSSISNQTEISFE